MPPSIKMTLLSLLAIPTTLFAADDDMELAALMTMLDEETELATQSKMNADYVPGMVTVLHGEELQAYGATTVADALDQVAGFYMTTNTSGDPAAIVRGVGASLNGSNLKILIDGVAVNRPVDATADWSMRMPVTQIDRVEVIRGPGSALYGEFAFSGVVNIITRKANSVDTRLGSDQHRQADGLVNHTFASGAQMSVNVSAWKRDDSGLQSNPDNFAWSNLGYSPGDIYDNEQGQMLLADLSHHGYQLQVQLAKVERGGWDGRNAVMPQDLEPREETVHNIQLNKTWQLNTDLSIGASLSSQATKVDTATYLTIPAGIDPPGPFPLVLVDIYRQDGNEDAAQRASANLHWSPADSHEIFFELEHVQSKVESAFVKFYEIGTPPVYGSPDQTQVSAGSSRHLSSATLQDQWQVTDALEITFGARYDRYSDWGSNTSPRIAAVWRAGERHIFKAQYAEAFRPPTLLEQYTSPNFTPNFQASDLEAEQLDSSELAYIYRHAGVRFRSTLFHTRVKDLIVFSQSVNTPTTWRNHGDIDTVGLELEWHQTVNRNWDWFANASYVDAEDKFDPDQVLLGSVDWLGNLGATWHASDRYRHSLLLHYVGKQEGWQPPPNRPGLSEFDAYTTLDYTVSVKRLLNIDDLDLTISINNLTDKDYAVVPTPNQYPYGLARGERTAWLQLSYDF